MQKLTSLDDFIPDRRTVVALGNFDGVHLGHKRIIERTVNEAKENNLIPVCFTFSNHPKELIGNMDEMLKPIVSDDEKADLMEELGIEVYLSVPFTREIMEISAETFFKDIIIRRLNASIICCGFNYHFGSHALGDTDLLLALSREENIHAIVEDAVIVDGNVVSSTLIRKAIKNGEDYKCSLLLGRPYHRRKD